MASTQIAQRLLSAETELELSKLRNGQLEAYEWEQLNNRSGALAKAPLFINDTPALSIYDLRAKCRRLKAEKGIQLVIIDYLQLMTAGNSKAGNREQEIASISRALKELAKELNVAVIALSQLSRMVEVRGGDKRPILSDLRESGSIEQDADLVAFLYRPEYYGLEVDDDGNSTRGIAEVIVAKQRNGPTDTVKLNFVNRYAKFTDLHDADYSSPAISFNKESGLDSGDGNTGSFKTRKFSSRMNETGEEDTLSGGFEMPPF
jgi:replicative DNA helicase